MEAAPVVGKLGIPPGFGFVPDDEVIISHYLLPRIQGHRLPANGQILEGEPLSAPPWLLLEKHERKGDAFFFATGLAKNRKGSRQNRRCVGGGTWKGERKVYPQDQKMLVPGDGGDGIEVAWQKYALSFREDGVKGSTGWVMHEYYITAPPELAESPMRVYRIRDSGHGKNSKKRKRGAQESDGCNEDEAKRHAATRPAVAETALFLGEGPSASESHSTCSSPVVAEDLMYGNHQAHGANLADGSDIAVPAATLQDQDLSALLDGSSPVFEMPVAENIDEFMCSLGDLRLPGWCSFLAMKGSPGSHPFPDGVSSCCTAS
ncbi:hypothetical protein ACP70R_036963 [Stipagrostis hirtigluma subsp. patula]